MWPAFFLCSSFHATGPEALHWLQNGMLDTTEGTFMGDWGAWDVMEQSTNQGAICASLDPTG